VRKNASPKIGLPASPPFFQAQNHVRDRRLLSPGSQLHPLRAGRSFGDAPPGDHRIAVASGGTGTWEGSRSAEFGPDCKNDLIRGRGGETRPSCIAERRSEPVHGSTCCYPTRYIHDPDEKPGTAQGPQTPGCTYGLNSGVMKEGRFYHIPRERLFPGVDETSGVEGGLSRPWFTARRNGSRAGA